MSFIPKIQRTIKEYKEYNQPEIIYNDKIHKLSSVRLVCKEGKTFKIHRDSDLFMVNYFEIGLKRRNKRKKKRSGTIFPLFRDKIKAPKAENYAILFTTTSLVSFYTKKSLFTDTKTKNSGIFIALKEGYDDWLAWRGTYLYMELGKKNYPSYITAQLYKKKSSKFIPVVDEYNNFILLTLKMSF